MAKREITLVYDAETGKVTQKIDEVNDAIRESQDETEKLNRKFGDLGDAGDEFLSIADSLTGGLVTGFGDAFKSVKNVTTGFKGLRAAIISTGIGALIVALGALVNWFVSTEKGARLLDRATIALQIVFKQVSDAVNSFLENDLVAFFEDPIESITGFGEAIKNYLIDNVNKFLDGLGLLGEAVSKLFEGDFQGAMDAASEGALKLLDAGTRLNPATAVLRLQMDALGGVVETVADAYEEADEQAGKMEATNHRLMEVTKRLTVENARLQSGIEVQQKIIDDTTRSYEDRLDALDRQSAMTVQLAENEAQLARLNEQTIRDQISITHSYEDRVDLEQQLADAQAERIEAEAAVTLIELENEQKRREIDLEELDRKRSINQAIEDLRNENIEDERARLEQQREIELERAVQELELQRATAEEIKAFKTEFEAQTNAQLKELDEERAADVREREQSIREILDESYQADQETAIERELAELEKQKQKDLAELTELEASEAQKNALIENYAKQEDEIREKYAELEKQRQADVNKQRVDLAMEAVGALTALANEVDSKDEAGARRAFERNKRVSLAQAIVSTAQGIIGQLAVPQDQLSGQNFIKAGIIAATGAAQIAKISSSRFQGGGSGTPTAPTAAGSAPAGGGGGAPTPSIDFGFLNQAQNENTVQAYVIGQSVTNQQQANQLVEDQARL